MPGAVSGYKDGISPGSSPQGPLGLKVEKDTINTLTYPGLQRRYEERGGKAKGPGGPRERTFCRRKMSISSTCYLHTRERISLIL